MTLSHGFYIERAIIKRIVARIQIIVLPATVLPIITFCVLSNSRWVIACEPEIEEIQVLGKMVHRNVYCIIPAVTSEMDFDFLKLVFVCG